MNPIRSVGARLTLALLLVVATAFAIAYLIVVPSLEHNLVGSKLDDLNRDMVTTRTVLLDSPQSNWLFDAVTLQQQLNVRVAVIAPTGEIVADSGDFKSLRGDPVAIAALRFGHAQRGTVSRNETRYAEAAAPLADGYVVLLSASLHDTLRNVSLIRRKLALAAAIAIVFSVLVGFGAARIFARRLRRLERAADAIAAGNLVDPVVDPTPDEVGQLAAAMDRMREHLASFDRARGEFIANASHELRTPLFSLSGFLELLLDEELDEETRREFLQQMREQVRRLTKLATDLLDLSRLDAGAIRIEVDRVDLGSIAETLVEEFGPAARVGDHLLAAVTGGDVPALADEERVLQIGRALVENAIRHTPAGTRIVVRATTDGIAPRLEVENGGPAIPAEAHEQVFQRFFRLDGSRASGSGLGLAIARQLAELMQGSLELESDAEHTVFRLVLPAGAAAWQRREPVYG